MCGALDIIIFDRSRASKDIDHFRSARAVLEYLLHHYRGGAAGSTDTAPMEAVRSYLTSTNEAAVVEMTGPRGTGRQGETR